MATEIEHKFLLANDDWRAFVTHSVEYKQGYLTNDDNSSSVRVRIADNQAWLNIKSVTVGTQRQEFEYEIPVADAAYMIDTLCYKPIIEKTRYFIPAGVHVWEIDVFAGDNAGLVVAEIELTVENEFFDKPTWLGEEVTSDVRYYNNQLCRYPYSIWQ